MGFVGLARNEETFQPEAYMASLPESLVDRRSSCSTRCSRPAARWCTAAACSPQRGATAITVLCALAAPEGLAPAGGERAAAAGVHRQRRRAAQRARLHRPGARRRRGPPVRRGLTMRFGVLGTGYWAQGGARRGPRGASDGRAGRRLGARPREGQGRRRGVRRRRVRRRRRAALPGRRRVDRAPARTSRRRWPSAPQRRASTCCWRSRSPWTSPVPTAWSNAVRGAGVASVVFFTVPVPAGDVVLAAAGRPRTTLAGGHRVTWLSSLGRVTRSTPRPGASEHGALWDIGPHALSVLVPALGPVISVQAGARAPGHRAPGADQHESGVASTVTLSHTVAPMSAGTEFFVHGDAGRIVLIPEDAAPHRGVLGRRRRADRRGGDRRHPSVRRRLRAGRRRRAGGGGSTLPVSSPSSARLRAVARCPAFTRPISVS